MMDKIEFKKLCYDYALVTPESRLTMLIKLFVKSRIEGADKNLFDEEIANHILNLTCKLEENTPDCLEVKRRNYVMKDIQKAINIVFLGHLINKTVKVKEDVKAKEGNLIIDEDEVDLTADEPVISIDAEELRSMEIDEEYCKLLGVEVKNNE
jgi:hypothetical protein